MIYFPHRAWSRRYGNDFFTVKWEGWKLATEDVCCSKRQYAIFDVRIFAGDNSWSLNFRMKSLYELWDAVYEHIDRNLPYEAPPRKTLFRNTDEAFLNDRMKKIEYFLDKLLAQYNAGTTMLKIPIDEAFGLNKIKAASEEGLKDL